MKVHKHVPSVTESTKILKIVTSRLYNKIKGHEKCIILMSKIGITLLI